ncbi:replication initiation protein (plasmid) [Escherichia coli]|nr:replication initiation protein [Escherichia coli]
MNEGANRAYRGNIQYHKDFKKRVLDPAVDIINANTNLSVTYEGIKSGRKIESVVFTYLVENETHDGKKVATKPLRPRLPSRPRVIKGSSAEVAWQKNVSMFQKVKLWHEITGWDFEESFWFSD